MRRFLATLAALALSTGAALAGDFAERAIIGFSPDGGYFAFEEYGVQDGSGFPYSNIYIVETATDSWVEGTPIRVRVDDESAELQTVRANAYSEAVTLVTDLSIGVAGRHLVHNPVTELGDSKNVDFLLRAFSLLPDDGWNLRVEDIPFETDCPDGFGYDAYVGFDLWLTSPEGETQRINHDTAIPDSRGCPVEYSVSDVIAFDGADGTVLITLINMFQLGFEGPDRRYLAVATILHAE